MLIVPLALVAVLMSTTLTQSATAAWVAPVGPPTLIVRAFDRPVPNWLPGHRGVDLRAVKGEQIRAAGAGRIIWSGSIVGRGVVVISHANGLRTTYEPVRSAVVVGQFVRAGEPIGYIDAGQSHCGGPTWCLHWGLRRGVDYLDPMLLIHLGRPRLIPVQDNAPTKPANHATTNSPRQPSGPSVEGPPWCASDRCGIRLHRELGRSQPT